jgi:hypothetical protein
VRNFNQFSTIPLLVVTAIIVLCLSAVGCDSKKYSLVEVSGKVTLDGKPVLGAVVNFQPQAADSRTPGPGSTARCDPEGRFQLNTIRDEPGAVIGLHNVRIFSYSPESPIKDDGGTVSKKEMIPDRYNYASTLTFEVPANGTSNADFELTTK